MIFVLIPQDVALNILFPPYNLRRDFVRKLLKIFKLTSFEYFMTVPPCEAPGPGGLGGGAPQEGQRVLGAGASQEGQWP